MVQVDKKEKANTESVGNPDEIDIIRCETYAPVALDGVVRQSFNMKDVSVKYNTRTQLLTVVGKKQTVLVPISNISFMHV
jgi:hypothetical protein